jgi:peptidoglycan/LPS O-acetylase OafA/YrhL
MIHCVTSLRRSTTLTPIRGVHMASLPQRPGEIRALAGARALPPLLLVLYHYHEGHGYQNVPLFDIFVAKGYLWVEFFFALSGFVLVHVYGPRVEEFFRGHGHREFLKARLARLYPLHLVTLLIMLGMIIVLRAFAHSGGYISIYDTPSYHPFATWQSFIANLFLVQAWHLFRQLSWNGVSWFVSVEFFLCLIFPLYLWASRGGTKAGLVMVLLGFAALRVMAEQSGHGLDITADFGVLRGMADFAVGVGLAMLYREGKAKGLGEWSELRWSAIQLAIAAIFLYAIYHTGWSHQMRDFWVVPPMTAMILAVAYDRGILARALQTRPLRQLGEWSFAIYMGQTTWLQYLRFAEQRFYPNPAADWQTTIHWLEPLGLVIVCTLWGWALFALVEQPANRWIRSRFMRGTAPA